MRDVWGMLESASQREAVMPIGCGDLFSLFDAGYGRRMGTAVLQWSLMVSDRGKAKTGVPRKGA
jgi:hypothetical protein